MSFKNGSVIITGGSKGIGLSIATVFARNTERPIVIIARKKDDLKEASELLKKEGANEVYTISLDITNEQSVSEVDFSEYNPAILINNAGSFLFKNLEDTDIEEFKGQFQINTLGAYVVTKSILPLLKAIDRSLIVNICSTGSLIGMENSGAYAMSKHALIGFSRSLRKELMKTNIAVTSLNLGQTYSTSWQDVDIDPKKLIDPEDVGRLILGLSGLSKRSVAEEIMLMPQGGEVAPV